ncbi:MAG: hypothetical protein CMC55_07105 [Flavobacteriaceae bacterium]|nr:hypothetical protein [Flavobacteriaceae bacterium]
MKVPSLENFLKTFAKKVVKDSQEILAASKDSQGNSRGDTALGKSIRFEVVPTATGFDTKFYMADYGTFLDKGVKGTKSNYIENSKTNYSYKNKQPPSGIIEKWIKKKGIKGRVDKKWKSAGNKGGQFITHKSLAFLIARSIKQKGIKSLSFFQKPLGVEYEKLKEQILDVLKVDIENYITTYTK